MPHTNGAVNYKNDLLINIISEILPNGDYEWQDVSFAYPEQSKEEIPRNTDDLKRHWMKTICNKMKKKPMGKPGRGVNDRIYQGISIEKKILNKTHLGMLGLSTDNKDNVPSGSEDVDLFGEESVGEGG
jgi:hypothetical protein